MRYEAPDADTIETEARRTVGSAPPPTLSAVSFSIGLALLVAVFLLLNPIWDAANMGAWNQNIWWSYAALPPVVAVLLALERKLVPASVLLETIKLTFVKFTLTFAIAQIVWELHGVPGTGVPDAGPVAVDVQPQRYELHAQPPASQIPAARTGEVVGRVTTAAGEPLSGALVWIAGGLEQFVFAAPTEAVVLENRGAGFEPELAIVRTFQPLVLINRDTQLHTAVIADEAGQRLLNFPVIPRGERRLMLDRAVGIAHLRCTGHGAAEPGVELVVLDSPFVTRTDADGRYRFEGVPAASLLLIARTAGGTQETRVALAPGATATADLALNYSR